MCLVSYSLCSLHIPFLFLIPVLNKVIICTCMSKYSVHFVIHDIEKSRKHQNGYLGQISFHHDSLICFQHILHMLSLFFQLKYCFLMCLIGDLGTIHFCRASFLIFHLDKVNGIIRRQNSYIQQTKPLV
jgi:hypothetical protein